jgi:hypothetical protein
MYGFASTQDLYLCGVYGYANKAGGAAGFVDLHLMFNGEPDAEETTFLTKHTFGLQTVGTSGAPFEWCVPKKFEGPGIVKMRIISGTNDMDIDAGFSGYLTTDTW